MVEMKTAKRKEKKRKDGILTRKKKGLQKNEVKMLELKLCNN